MQELREVAVYGFNVENDENYVEIYRGLFHRWADKETDDGHYKTVAIVENKGRVGGIT